MSRRRFSIQLTILTIVVAIFILGLQQLPGVPSFQLYAWASLLIFVALSIAMYAMGYRAVQSTDKYAFINVALLMMIFKMFLSVSIALVYKLKSVNFSMVFVALFLGIYVVYTIFETYFMMQLSKMKPK